MEQLQLQDLSILVIAILIAFLGIKFIHFIRSYIAKFFNKLRILNYTRPTEGTIKGFGLVYRGAPILDGSEPLLFDSPKIAMDYAMKREFGKKNSICNFNTPLHVVWQNWDLNNNTLEINELRNLDGTPMKFFIGER